MKPALLDWLVCPACRGTLRCETTETRGEEILAGSLTCRACGGRYAITQGVPRMAPAALAPEQERTARAFGYEWQRFDRFHPEYERQFLEWVAPLTPADFQGRMVLDAGCGMGRHALLSAKFGAAPVIGVDLSAAVDVTYRNAADLPNVHVVQADICQLPFRAPFDLAYSVGVLHHLPDPERGFLSLVSHVKPGGRIAAWVYGEEGNFAVTRILNPIRLAITSRLPLRALDALSWLPAALAYPFLKTVFRAIQRRPALRERLSGIPYLEYACYLSELGLVPLHSIVFDHLAPEISYYLRQEDVEVWCRKARLEDRHVGWHKRYSWRVQGRRPLRPDGRSDGSGGEEGEDRESAGEGSSISRALDSQRTAV
jgi:SAM-dependent methyltransferase